MAGLLMVIVTLTPCSVIFDFVVDCQVFGLLLRVHVMVQKNRQNIIWEDVHQNYDRYLMNISIITRRRPNLYGTIVQDDKSEFGARGHKCDCLRRSDAFPLHLGKLAGTAFSDAASERQTCRAAGEALYGVDRSATPR
jgi:hypothetical protein